ncbi:MULTISPECIES: hypothetical protein [Salinibaculum]|uniref:hypothetical protein n=1 Tax=Salinibaculum TaxID=2732368 RepID=UPI0030D22444
MSQSKGGHPGAPQAGSVVRNYADLLNWLPDPPETFFMADVPEDYVGTIRSLSHDSVIAKEGWEAYDGESMPTENSRRVWKVESWASERAAEIVANRDAICPCGHAGVQNCGDHYACSFEACDQAFERDELEVDR